MLLRACAIVLALAGTTGVFLAAHNPPLGLIEGPVFSLVGLAGLGMLTLRSETHRRVPQRD